MAQTLYRLGLWTIVLVLGAYVVRETFRDSRPGEIITMRLLQRGGVVGLLLIAGSGVARILERTAVKGLKKSRCAICRLPIPPGEIYCRTHLREILDRESELSRRSKLR